MQWEVRTRYNNQIQPYRLGRQLYPCYQNRLCIIQLGYEIVVVVNWFLCWGPVTKGWDINATLLFFYSTAPRTSCLGSRSLVTTVLLRQGQQTQLGGKSFSSWQPVAVLLTQAGLPLCQSHLDPLQLSHLCLNLWEVLSPERHGSPAV